MNERVTGDVWFAALTMNAAVRTSPFHSPGSCKIGPEPRQLLGLAALCVLAGRWIDLSLMILPTQGDASGWPGVLEAGLLLGTIVILVLASIKQQGRVAPGRS
jgi:hypothetical protein